MSLNLVRTTDERLVGAGVERALRAGLAAAGRAVLLVPSTRSTPSARSRRREGFRSASR